MTNVIFLHGINSQTTGYSNQLFDNIKNAYYRVLLKSGMSVDEAQQNVASLVQKEIIWADVTTDLTNRYIELEYELFGKKKGFWNFLCKNVDPLVLQILYYVRDKGDKQTGVMSILKRVDEKFKEIAETSSDMVIVAHSLGSVVAFDYLFGFRKYSADSSWNIKALITLGSPIPLFISAMGHADSDASLPLNLKTWFNVFDKEDGVARRCKPFFKNVPVEDVGVSTGFLPINAHSKYWKNRQTARIIAQIIAKS